MTLTVGSLFSGIGGLELGLERAGMRTIWQCENDPYASRVLTKHWPDIPNLGGITRVDWMTVERPDLVCGGFPCQDISTANSGTARAGLRGAKSGLWWEFSRAVRALAPRWIVVENVSTNWRAWLPFVRCDLHGLGYSSLPVELPARALGAPHRRNRIFVMAHSHRDGEPLVAIHEKASQLRSLPIHSGHWGLPLPATLRMDDGIPAGVDRLRCLGNAVVPQVSEWIGRQIVNGAA